MRNFFRDLSIINTPPPNRQPIQTELHVFNDDYIREAIYYETERGALNDEVQLYKLFALVNQ